MADHSNPTVEPPASTAPRAWTDPVCTEYAVGDLTQAGAFGAGDGGIFS